MNLSPIVQISVRGVLGKILPLQIIGISRLLVFECIWLQITYLLSYRKKIPRNDGTHRNTNNTGVTTDGQYLTPRNLTPSDMTTLNLAPNDLHPRNVKTPFDLSQVEIISENNSRQHPRDAYEEIHHHGNTLQPNGVTPDHIIHHHDNTLRPNGVTPDHIIHRHDNTLRPNGVNPDHIIHRHDNTLQPNGVTPDHIIHRHDNTLRPNGVTPDHIIHHHDNTLQPNGIDSLDPNQVKSYEDTSGAMDGVYELTHTTSGDITNGNTSTIYDSLETSQYDILLLPATIFHEYENNFTGGAYQNIGRDRETLP